MRNEIRVEIRKTEIVVNKDLSVNTNEKYQFYLSNSLEQVASLISGNQGNKSVIKEIKNILKNQKFNEKHSLTFENVFDRFKDENILKKYVFIKYDFEVIGNVVARKQKDEATVKKDKEHRELQKQNGKKIKEERRKFFVDNVNKFGVKIGDVTILPIVTLRNAHFPNRVEEVKHSMLRYRLEDILNTLCKQQFIYEKDGIIGFYYNFTRYSIDDFIQGKHIKKQVVIDDFMLAQLEKTDSHFEDVINEFTQKL